MSVLSNLRPFLITFGLHVAEAILILLLGRWIARLLQRSTRSLLKRTNVSPALSEILLRAIYYTILLIATFLALVILGIPANALISVLVVLILVAAVALRESLRDLAATVNFVIFQPFKVGDIIDTNGVVGIVKEILLFQTILVTRDNRQAFIPNGNIQNNTIINMSALPYNRLDLTVPLNYSADVRATKDALLEIANEDPCILRDPAPFVDVWELGVGQVEYILRVYAKPLDFWKLQSTLNERIKLLMEQRQLMVPLPQLQVHAESGLSLEPEAK